MSTSISMVLLFKVAIYGWSWSWSRSQNKGQRWIVYIYIIYIKTVWYMGDTSTPYSHHTESFLVCLLSDLRITINYVHMWQTTAWILNIVILSSSKRSLGRQFMGLSYFCRGNWRGGGAGFSNLQFCLLILYLVASVSIIHRSVYSYPILTSTTLPGT